MKTNPNSRIQVLDSPVQLPGICTICGSSGGDGRKFLDYGMQLDWYGAVYFCSFCIKECAMAVEFVPVENFDQLHTDYRELQVKNDRLVKENEALRHAMATLLDGSNSGIAVSSSSVSSSKSTVEDSREFESPNDSDVFGDSETGELDVLKGLDDLLESPGDDED